MFTVALPAEPKVVEQAPAPLNVRFRSLTSAVVVIEPEPVRAEPAAYNAPVVSVPPLKLIAPIAAVFVPE